jgi:hypothetical protein
MSNVTIYRFVILDPEKMHRRRVRWGTRQAVAGLEDARVIEGSATSVDASILDEDGFTAPDFEPI